MCVKATCLAFGLLVDVLTCGGKSGFCMSSTTLQKINHLFHTSKAPLHPQKTMVGVLFPGKSGIQRKSAYAWKRSSDWFYEWDNVRRLPSHRLYLEKRQEKSWWRPLINTHWTHSLSQSPEEINLHTSGINFSNRAIKKYKVSLSSSHKEHLE